MSKKPKNVVSGKRHGFTLIELIIVVVIVAILALVALPRYFANIEKAQRNTVYATLDTIRQAMLSYYAANGVYSAQNVWPVTVIIDGDTILNVADPSNSYWTYFQGPGGYGWCDGAMAYAENSGHTCFYGLCVAGNKVGTCQPQ
jgi:prepilin-type N-terminal cleavage/methylation domain-containing protein